MVTTSRSQQGGYQLNKDHETAYCKHAFVSRTSQTGGKTGLLQSSEWNS